MRGLNPFWKQQLSDLTQKGKQSVDTWWLQNKDKYGTVLAKTGVVPGVLSVLCLSAALQLTNQWQVIVDGNMLGVVKEPKSIVSYVQELDDANRENYESASLLNEMKIARSYGTPAVPTTEMQLVLADTLQWAIPGAVISIDDQDVIALEDASCAQSVLETIKQKTAEQLAQLYKQFNIVSLDIQEDLKVCEKPVAIASLVDEQTAEAMLMATKRPQQPRTTVASRSSRASVAQTVMPVAAAATEEPLVHVEAKVEVVETKSIPFETEYVKVSSLYKGDKQTVTKGQKGTDEVTSVKTLVNGKVVESEVKNVTRTKEPVTEVIKEGTKVASVTGSGRFAWPTKGYISSRYGYRWGSMHRAIDIAAPSGTPIVAADAGVVTFSGTKSSYGKIVEIDHGNGYVTRYAHCSQLVVAKGARVSRGQLIAKVGRTGFATGNHVHFEVLYRGVNKDPLTFLR